MNVENKSIVEKIGTLDIALSGIWSEHIRFKAKMAIMDTTKHILNSLHLRESNVHNVTQLIDY